MLAKLMNWLRGFDPLADRGTGPLRRCQMCHAARHDVEDDLCRPCNARTW